MQRRILRSLAAGAVLVAVVLALGSAVPAGAGQPGLLGAAAACPINGACVYSDAAETGTMAQLSGGFGCHSAASLGLPAVRSAVNNAVEQAITLFLDGSCRTPANPAFVIRQVDDINPPALGVRIRPLP
jgi:hypothetical protein